MPKRRSPQKRRTRGVSPPAARTRGIPLNTSEKQMINRTYFNFDNTRRVPRKRKAVSTLLGVSEKSVGKETAYYRKHRRVSDVGRPGNRQQKPSRLRDALDGKASSVIRDIITFEHSMGRHVSIPNLIRILCGKPHNLSKDVATPPALRRLLLKMKYEFREGQGMRNSTIQSRQAHMEAIKEFIRLREGNAALPPGDRWGWATGDETYLHEYFGYNKSFFLRGERINIKGH